MSDLWQQAGLSEPLIEQLQTQVQTRLEDALYWFPVRHHSPHCAFALQQAILKRRPKQIFIELPSQFKDTLSLISDPKTKPPIALYSSFKDQHNELGLAGITTPSLDIMPSLGSWIPSARKSFLLTFQLIKGPASHPQKRQQTTIVWIHL